MARPGPWTPARVYEMFPRLAERKTNLGTQLSGGEQQMLAVGRALVAQSAAAAAGRAAGRPGADHRRGAAAGDRAASRATKACRRSSSSSIRKRSWRSRTGPSCSTTARWCIRGAAQDLKDAPELLDRLLGVAR